LALQVVQPDRDRGFNPFFGLDMDERLQAFLAVDILVDISDAVETGNNGC
jgi:hypothetical protein